MPPITPIPLKAWAIAATRRRMNLHFQMASPVQAEREQAFTLMSALAEEAIAMVRAAADTLSDRDEWLAKRKPLEDATRDHTPLDDTREHPAMK